MRTIALITAALSLPLLCLGAQCTPTSSPPAPTPAPAPVTQDASAPVAVDAGPDPIALELCVENFEALNPDLPKDQVIDTFCSGPAALAPWELRAASKRAH